MSTGQIIGVASGIAGGVVGGVLGGPQGAAIGFSLGMAFGGIAGSMAFPEGPKMQHQPPPQAHENQWQSSVYGTMLPIISGTKICAGNIIWMSPIKETRKIKHVHDDQGGSIGDYDLISYTYTADFCVAFCKGAISAFSRIWVNNEVWLDLRDPAGTYYPSDGTSVGAYYNYDKSNKKKRTYFTLYLGAETDGEDATIAAHEGTGNVPGYRDCAKIVFKDFPVGQYSGVPNIKAEILTDSSDSDVDTEIIVNDAISFTSYLRRTFGNYSFTIDGNFVVYDIITDEFVILRGFTTTVLQKFRPVYPSAGTGTNYMYAFTIDPVTGKMFYVTQNNTYQRLVKLSSPGGNIQYSYEQAPGTWGTWVANAVALSSPYGALMVIGDVMYSHDYIFGYSRNVFSKRDRGEFGSVKWTQSSNQTRVTLSDGSTTDHTSQYILASDDTYIYMSFPSGSEISAIDGAVNFAGTIRITPSETYIDGSGRWVIPTGSYTIVYTYAGGTQSIPIGFTGDIFETSDCWYLLPTVSGGDYTLKIYEDFTPTALQRTFISEASVPLDDVVTTICEEANLTSAQIDVTDLAAYDVLGYMIPRQMQARNALEPLLAAYNIDAVEIDWKLHFVRRGVASIVTIPADEIGARFLGEQHKLEPIEMFAQPYELPTEIVINYESKARDGDSGSQRAVRVDKNYYLPMNVSLGVVLTDSYAKQLAEIMLKLYWTAAEKYQFSTTSKYLYLAPTNVITLNGKNLRIIEMVDKSGVIEFTAVYEGSGVYTSSATASDISFGIIDIGRYDYIPSVILLDMPIFSSEHNNAGIYVAGYGPSGSYLGGRLQLSYDGGTSFVDAAYFESTSAVVGQCSSTLGDSGTNATIDYDNTLTVDMAATGETLSTITEAQLLAGTNLAAVGSESNGWEIVQFMTATNVSGSIYTLSGFLRGLYGTQHKTATHSSGEYLIILDSLTGIERVSLNSAYINVELAYRATTFSGELSYSSLNFTNTAIGLKPYAPTNIIGARNSSRDLTIYWKRNDRLEFTQKDMPNNADVPMSEDTESYEIDILDALGTTVLRTITATTGTASYTAAQQTTDFGSAQNSIKMNIYQISGVAAIDRGYAGYAVL